MGFLTRWSNPQTKSCYRTSLAPLLALLSGRPCSLSTNIIIDGLWHHRYSCSRKWDAVADSLLARLVFANMGQNLVDILYPSFKRKLAK